MTSPHKQRRKLKNPIVKRGNKRSLSIPALRAAFQENSPLRQPVVRDSPARLGLLSLYSKIAATECVRGCYQERKNQDSLVALLKEIPRLIEASASKSETKPRAASKPIRLAWGKALARATAIGIHVRLHQAFHRGLRQSPVRPTDTLAKQITMEERTYRSFLARTRLAARRSDITGAMKLLTSVVDQAHLFADLCSRAARASRSRKGALLGLSVSSLARQYAMLAAGLVLVIERLQDPRSSKATATVARTRKRLSRSVVRLPTARRSLTGTRVGAKAAIVGRIESLAWQDRTRKPFSVARLADKRGALLVPYKSMRQQGVSAGANVWAQGKVKRNSKGSRYLEVEFEGVGKHQQRYWEDWLAQLARPAYDLYPGTLLMEWEFPRLGRRSAASDMYSRIT
jgi:hypothetical protein